MRFGPPVRNPCVELFSMQRGSELGVQTSQNRGLLDLLRTSRPHGSTCHSVARRIVGTRGPEEAWETSISIFVEIDLHKNVNKWWL